MYKYNYTVDKKAKDSFCYLCKKQKNKSKEYTIIKYYNLGKKIDEGKLIISTYHGINLIYNKTTKTIENIVRVNNSTKVIKIEGQVKILYDELYHCRNNPFKSIFIFISFYFKKTKFKLSKEYTTQIKIVKSKLLQEYTASFDGSYKEDINVVSIGYEIKKGYEVLRRESRILDIGEDIHRNKLGFYAEIMALKMLLMEVEQMKIKRINIAGDCQGLIESINANREGTKFRSDIEDILKIKNNGNNDYNIRWKSRKFNRSAHLLANGVI